MSFWPHLFLASLEGLVTAAVLALTALGLSLGILGVGLCLLHGCLGEAHGDLEVGRVDDHQQIALVHELVIGDGELYDPT